LFRKYINDFHILRTKFRKDIPLRPEDNWIENPQDLEGDEFQSWFDTSNSEEQAKSQAKIDFEHRIIRDLEDLDYQNSCEIGFGGGRLLLEASKHFNKAYGIDIHSNFSQTERFLISNSRSNFKLLHFKDAENLPKINLFYSFIVIQHFEKVEVLKKYLSLIHKKLTEGGMAVLWYGKLSTLLWGRYYEVPKEKFRIRECSLFIRPEYMEQLCKNFKIVEHSINNPKDPQTNKGHSMQAKILLQKV